MGTKSKLVMGVIINTQKLRFFTFNIYTCARAVCKTYLNNANEMCYNFV